MVEKRKGYTKLDEIEFWKLENAICKFKIQVFKFIYKSLGIFLEEKWSNYLSKAVKMPVKIISCTK